jgi:hypothetical protein
MSDLERHPPPPESLVGALHDTIHKDIGLVKGVRSGKVRQLIDDLNRRINELTEERNRLDIECGYLSGLKDPQLFVYGPEDQYEEEVVVLHDGSEWVRRERYVELLTKHVLRGGGA